MNIQRVSLAIEHGDDKRDVALTAVMLNGGLDVIERVPAAGAFEQILDLPFDGVAFGGECVLGVVPYCPYILPRNHLPGIAPRVRLRQVRWQ